MGLLGHLVCVSPAGRRASSWVASGLVHPFQNSSCHGVKGFLMPFVQVPVGAGFQEADRATQHKQKVWGGRL